jgi:hypothetical protein
VCLYCSTEQFFTLQFLHWICFLWLWIPTANIMCPAHASCYHPSPNFPWKEARPAFTASLSFTLPPPSHATCVVYLGCACHIASLCDLQDCCTRVERILVREMAALGTSPLRHKPLLWSISMSLERTLGRKPLWRFLPPCQVLPAAAAHLSFDSEQGHY